MSYGLAVWESQVSYVLETSPNFASSTCILLGVGKGLYFDVHFRIYVSSLFNCVESRFLKIRLRSSGCFRILNEARLNFMIFNRALDPSASLLYIFNS